MIFLFTSDQYEMLYIYFFSHYSPQKILLEHVSMHMIKRKCNMYMEDREWEAIKKSEDKGIMMGTTITIKLKGQSVFFFFIFYYPSVSCFLLKNISSFLFLLCCPPWLRSLERSPIQGWCCYCSTKRRRRT